MTDVERIKQRAAELETRVSELEKKVDSLISAINGGDPLEGQQKFDLSDCSDAIGNRKG